MTNPLTPEQVRKWIIGKLLVTYPENNNNKIKEYNAIINSLSSDIYNPDYGLKAVAARRDANRT